jgi:N6-L-threonylcarbamoyladenine synthase
MLVLGIESSCDETAASIVEDGRIVLSSEISSQIASHAAYGGVIPELAAREHLTNIETVVHQAVVKAGKTFADIDGIAVTSSPGLLPALLVGTSYASGLAQTLNKPIVGVNHLIGHIYGAFLDQPDLIDSQADYPIIALLVSGGHTQILIVQENGKCEIIGRTIDDAAGEAFDKAAKILDLGYPGGPVIDKLAQIGNPKAYSFPRPLTGEGGRAVSPENKYNFSFSGLKTALLYQVKGKEIANKDLPDLAASYQDTIIYVLAKKVFKAAKHYRAKTILIGGGVACNSGLRKRFTELCEEKKLRLVLTSPKYCTDNAAMIGGLGYHTLKNKEKSTQPEEIPASARCGDISYLPFLQK